MASRKSTAKGFLIGLRCLIGGIFVLAGLVKLRSPGAFIDAIETFQLVPYRFAFLGGFLLPAVEFWAGLALTCGYLRRGALTLLGILTIMFISVLAWSWVRGLDIACGCFGDLFPEDTSYPALILRNLMILVGITGLAAEEIFRSARASDQEKRSCGDV